MLTNPNLLGDYTSVQENIEDSGNRYTQYTPHGWELDSYRVVAGTLAMHPALLGPSVAPLSGNQGLVIETAGKASRTLLRQPVTPEAGLYALTARFTLNLLPVDLEKAYWWEEIKWRVILWDERGKIHELPWRCNSVWGGAELAFTEYFYTEGQALTVGVEWYAVSGETLPRGERPGIVIREIGMGPAEEAERYYRISYGMFMKRAGAFEESGETTGAAPIRAAWSGVSTEAASAVNADKETLWDESVFTAEPPATAKQEPRTIVVRLELGDNLAALLEKVIERLWPPT